jgi:hypothetical protein
MIPARYLAELTGYGITQVPHDGDYRVITVDVDAQTVKVRDRQAGPFADFAENGANW